MREREDNVRVAQVAASRNDRVAWVAAAQWGAIGYRQLRDCGLDRSMVSRWASQGRLHWRYPGVDAVGHPMLPIEGELTAALLFAGPGAALSHATAAWWWGLTDARTRVIDISVPGHRRPTSGIRIYRRRGLTPTAHRRLPIIPVIQTLLDFSSTAPLDRVRYALAEAEYHGLVDLDQVASALGRGRPGSARLRAALNCHQPELAKTRSWLEQAFIGLCESAGIPVPELNTTVCGYLVDAVWREQRVVVELDGLQGHRTPAQLERDHERDLVLRQNGFETRRYTWRQVTRKGDDVVADLPTCVLTLAP